MDGFDHFDRVADRGTNAFGSVFGADIPSREHSRHGGSETIIRGEVVIGHSDREVMGGECSNERKDRVEGFPKKRQLRGDRFDRFDRGGIIDGDSGHDAIDQIGRHRIDQRMAREDRDMRADLHESNGGLTGRVPPSDDRDLLAREPGESVGVTDFKHAESITTGDVQAFGS